MSDPSVNRNGGGAPIMGPAIKQPLAPPAGDPALKMQADGLILSKTARAAKPPVEAAAKPDLAKQVVPWVAGAVGAAVGLGALAALSTTLPLMVTFGAATLGIAALAPVILGVAAVGLVGGLAALAFWGAKKLF